MSDAFDRAREARDLLQAVASLKGDELGDPSDPKGLRANARSLLRSIQADGESFPCPALGAAVEVRTKGINKIISQSADLRKLQVLPAIREVFAQGVKTGETPPRDPALEPDTKAYHYLRATVELDGALLGVRVVVREDGRGTFHYDHTIDAPGPLLDSAKENAPADRGISDATSNDEGTYRSRIASAQLVASVARAAGLVNLLVETPSGSLLDSLPPLARIRAASTLAAKAAAYRAAVNLSALDRLRLAREIRDLIAELGGAANEAPAEPEALKALRAIAQGAADGESLAELFGRMQEAINALLQADALTGEAEAIAQDAITHWAERESKNAA